ncbi:MAG: FAD-dependent oxidoreductase [Alcanivoracaceae bacterium]|nr:FAD-dependent oxidoreductase [Alcanivoracaceae bacterium]
MKRIAIVGGGISGLTAAWVLSRNHHVTLFEAEERIGGHTHTVDVSVPSGEYKIDVGFIVFNDRTYPRFNQLLAQLGIGQRPASMGFAVSDEKTGLEYCGNGLKGVFAQKRNWLSLNHWRMVRDILRFNKEAMKLLETNAGEEPLASYLRREGYSERFISHYILPMGGAIWSCSDTQMAEFPARFFVQFFHNHGLLSLRNRPQWYVVPGGSRSYVERLLEQCNMQVRAGCPVSSVRREDGEVIVTSDAYGKEKFDDVVMACHADQSLRLLEDADQNERAVLSSVPYQENEVVLHTDTRLLPRNEQCWSSWNATLAVNASKTDPVQVTYNMNILQGVDAPETFCVTLNATQRIDPDKVLYRVKLFHPVFTPDGIALRQALDQVNGRKQVWFCGAWCRNGFHEDGVVSALKVAEGFGEEL